MHIYSLSRCHYVVISPNLAFQLIIPNFSENKSSLQQKNKQIPLIYIYANAIFSAVLQRELKKFLKFSWFQSYKYI